MTGHSTDLLEGPRHVFLPAGNEQGSCRHCIVGPPTQLLFLMHLFEQGLAAILREGEGGESKGKMMDTALGVQSSGKGISDTSSQLQYRGGLR